MKILLPPKKNNERQELSAGKHQITIIGANGSGKTRFTERLIKDLSGKAFRISIINAIYETRESDPLPGSIDILYKETAERTNLLRNDNVTQAERLMSLLLQEEMVNLISYKMTLLAVEGGGGC